MSTPSETVQKSSLAVPEKLSGSTAGAFESRLAALLQNEPEEIVIDCAGLEPVTSSHIALLWNAKCECASAGVRLRLGAPSGSLRRVLQVLDLENVFACDSATADETPLSKGDTSPGKAPASYQDEFPPSPEGIDAAIIRFLEYLSQLRVPELALFELRIVMYEITTNIMCHSTLSPLDRIGVDARVDASGLKLEISDPGTAFDPTAQAICTDYRQAGTNRQSRGFGLAMVRGLVDEMEYTRRNAKNNVLTVRKRWSADA